MQFTKEKMSKTYTRYMHSLSQQVLKEAVSRYRTAMKLEAPNQRPLQLPNLKEIDLVFNPGAGSGGIGLSMLQAMFSTQMVRDILITDEYKECFEAYFGEFGAHLVRDSHWETAEAIYQTARTFMLK